MHLIIVTQWSTKNSLASAWRKEMPNHIGRSLASEEQENDPAEETFGIDLAENKFQIVVFKTFVLQQFFEIVEF